MSQIIRFYNYASEGDLNLQISIKATGDDEILQINPSIYSFSSLPTSKFSIQFTLDYEMSALDVLLPKEERSDFHKHTQFVIKYMCKNSRKRGLYNLVKGVSLNKAKGNEIFECMIEHKPEEWFGDIDFTCLLIRVTESDNVEGFLTDKYSILAESGSKKLYIEPFQEASKGGQLDVRTGKLDFNDGDVEINALYQLKKDTSEIILNENAPKHILKALQHKYQNDGPGKKLQNALFAPIVVDVWEQLAREAFDEMVQSGSDDEPMDPADLSFPLNRIAEQIALILYDGSLEDAVTDLKHKLSNQITRRYLINKQLPLAVQVIGDLQNDYELAAESNFKNI